MKSLGTLNLFDVLVSAVRKQYNEAIRQIAAEAMACAGTDKDKLIDEVTQGVGYHVCELNAPFILSASPSANQFLKIDQIFADITEWEYIFQAVAQAAMEHDVHAHIAICQQDEAPIETA